MPMGKTSQRNTVAASYDCRGEDKTALTTPLPPSLTPHPMPPLPSSKAHLTYTTGAELPYTHTGLQKRCCGTTLRGHVHTYVHTPPDDRVATVCSVSRW